MLAIVQEYRQALQQCEELYRTGALECVQAGLLQEDESPEAFVGRMEDLHRGLAIKTFVEVAHSDRQWEEAELVLARELIQHVWSKRLKGEQLEQALERLVEQASDLSWAALVGPFERLEPLRQHVGLLQTLVVRMANMVAKADGRVRPEEVRQLLWIQAEMRRLLEPMPLVAGDGHEESHRNSQQALQEMPKTAEDVRVRCELEKAEKTSSQRKTPVQSLSEVLAELEALIGLGIIKQEVHGLVNFLQMQKERERFALPATPVTLHSVFRGNPGTGKTTVARLLGRVFGAMGILVKGHLIETDRSGLVAEYAGQTGPKTNKRIDEALDGVLFIDEAYSLVAESGDDPYGGESVQALLKRMEDDRARIVVVLAGYPEPMDRLLQSNPGLSSRFSRHFTFPDYTASELGCIFHGMCRKNQYELPTLTRVKLLLGFQHLLDRRDEHFGNGRLVRNVFEHSIRRLANRIAGIAPLTKELLTTLEPDDIEMAEVPDQVWSDLKSLTRSFRSTCPGCQQSSRLRQELMGQTVQCKRCGHRFAADWGELIEEE